MSCADSTLATPATKEGPLVRIVLGALLIVWFVLVAVLQGEPSIVAYAVVALLLFLPGCLLIWWGLYARRRAQAVRLEVAKQRQEQRQEQARRYRQEAPQRAKQQEEARRKKEEELAEAHARWVVSLCPPDRHEWESPTSSAEFDDCARCGAHREHNYWSVSAQSPNGRTYHEYK